MNNAMSIKTDYNVQERIQEEVLFKLMNKHNHRQWIASSNIVQERMVVFKFMMNKHNHRQWIAASDNTKQQQRLGLNNFKILGFQDLKIFQL